MKNIGIICEYNPFHRGHALQFDIIKKEFGDDCRIIALMSGNVVQRGETAVFCKYQRARAAVTSGADLVLELPYPYSGSCAEIFARGGVLAFSALGNIDCIAFGSENGELSELELIAKRLSEPMLDKKIAEITLKNPALSYPKARSEAYFSLYGQTLTDKPNDTLGIEYIKAARETGIPLFTYKRQPGYSATASREVCLSGGDRLPFIPEKANMMFDEEGASLEKYFGRAMLAFCMNADPEYLKTVFDMPFALAMSIVKYAPLCVSYGELITRLAGTNYTRARVKRAILYAYLGVTEGLPSTPPYLGMLSAGENGVKYLSEIRKTTRMTVISKHSHVKKLSPESRAIYDINIKADRLFCMTKPDPIPFSEYMKKGGEIIPSGE